MSLGHQFYLAIRLGSVLNLSIRQTAFYQIRMTVYHNHNSKETFTAPIEIIKSQAEMDEEETGEVLDEKSCTTQKIFIKHNSNYTDINTVFIFKGKIELAETRPQNQSIEIYCELMQYSGREVEVIGEWTGRSHLHSINSHMEIYFSSHFLSCAISSSIHCVISDFLIESQDEVMKYSKSKTFYNRSKQRQTNMYDAVMDPIIESVHQLESWRNQFKERQKMEEDENTDLRQSIKMMESRSGKYQSLNETIVDRKIPESLLSEEMSSLKRADYVKHLEKDIHYFSQHLYIIWKDYMSMFKKKQKGRYFSLLKEEHKKVLDKDHWINKIEIFDDKGKLVQQEHETEQNLQFCGFQEHLCKIKMSIHDMHRIKEKSQNQPFIKIQDHLLILVHGYQASSFDMEMIAMYFRYRNPTLHILISNTNQGRTQGSIEECGQRLAVEIKNFINLRELKNVKISLLGHSLGGIIIRASLPYLQLYKKNFHCYISLCSPHLGYLYHTSKIVSTSIWLMNKLKKDQSMIELTMSDHEDLTKTFIYELSDRPELSWFKRVILLGSKDDEYVPFSSALLQNMEFFYQSNSARTYQNIYNNLMRSIQSKVIRLEIAYNQKVKDLSGLIGRTGHIKVLSYLPLIELYTHLISKQL